MSDIISLMEIRCKDAFGRIDVRVAAAGIGRFAPLENVSEDEFDALTAIHFRGTFFTVQQAIPRRERAARSSSSASARATRGFPLTSVYNAAKAAVASLAVDVRASSSRVSGSACWYLIR